MTFPPSGQSRATFLTLATKAGALYRRKLTNETSHAAKRCLIDWFGLAIAGVREPAVQALLSALAFDSGPSRVVGLHERKLPAGSAALVMGTASHVLDYDDTDHINLIHVSSTLFPALFALTGTQVVNGRALLHAVAVGYAVEDRLGHYLGRKLTAHGWHVSGIIGHIGAAAASALMLELSEEELARAMAIGATGSSGFIAAFGTMSKSLQLGRAASAGVLAALLAKQGFTGPITGLDDNPGFMGPLIGGTVGSWDYVETGWDDPQAIERNSFKPHASCLITHPTVDAASAIRHAMQQSGHSTTTIETIECRINPLAPVVAGNPAPSTGLEGKFSLAFCCVAGLLHGRATPEVFAPEIVRDPTVRALVARVSIVADPDIGEQQAVITVGFSNGAFLSHKTDLAKGNPANPVTDRELEDKFLALSTPALGQMTRKVAETIWDFEQVADVTKWLAALPFKE